MGRNHINQFLALENVEVAAICDVDENLFPEIIRKQFVDKGLKKPKTYVDMRELYDDKDIDAVSIVTPNHWHALAAIWAMQAGKDVYVEKPVSHNISEGYEDAAETPNTQVVVHDYGDVTVVQEVRGLESSRFRIPAGAVFTGSEGHVGMTAGSSAFFDPSGQLIEKLPGEPEDHFGNFIEGVRSRDRSHLNAEILGGHLSAGLCHLGNISYCLGEEASAKEILAELESRKLRDDWGDTFERTRAHLAENGVDIEKTRLTLGPWLEFDPDKERFKGNEGANGMLARDYRAPFIVPKEEEV
jgi:hypothetical protein